MATTIDNDTELSAVNSILGSIGQSPVNSLNLQNPEIEFVYNVLTDNYKLCDIVTYIKQQCDMQINMVDTPLLNQYSYTVSDKKIRDLGFNPMDNLHESINSTLLMLSKLNG